MGQKLIGWMDEQLVGYLDEWIRRLLNEWKNTVTGWMVGSLIEMDE